MFCIDKTFDLTFDSLGMGERVLLQFNYREEMLCKYQKIKNTKIDTLN